MLPRTVPAPPRMSPKLLKLSDFPSRYLSFFPFPTFSCLKSAPLSRQRENKESRSPRSGAVDLPVVTDSIRNIKSMWEKGSVFSSPGGGGGGGQFKVTGEGTGGRLMDSLAPADVRATFPTGSSCDEDGRGRPHQRVAQQNPGERQDVRGAAIGGWLTLMLTPSHSRSNGGHFDSGSPYFGSIFWR